MERYSRFLAAVRAGLSRLENGRLGLFLCFVVLFH